MEQDQAIPLSELIRQREALEKQIQEAQRAARSDAITKIKELIATNGLTLADISGKGSPESPASAIMGGKADRKPVAAKYRNPDNASETWKGRGLKPKWLANALAEGKALGDFLILGEAEAEAA